MSKAKKKIPIKCQTLEEDTLDVQTAVKIELYPTVSLVPSLFACLFY